ncbi:MAG: hypothetical protein WAO19_03305 [Candidatus Kryptoniota bacterium]
MKRGPENERTESPQIADWQVVVSRDNRIIHVKQMSMEMSRTRLRPVFSLAGDLIIIVPGISEEAAKAEAGNIARHLSSAGKWGVDLLDLADLGFVR